MKTMKIAKDKKIPKSISLSKLRKNLKNLKFMNPEKTTSVTHYGEPIGFLVNYHLIQNLSLKNEKTQEISLTEFKERLTDCYIQFASGNIQCFYITYQKRIVVACIDSGLKKFLEDNFALPPK